MAKRQNQDRRHWLEYEITYAVEHSETKSLKEIGDHLDRSASCVGGLFHRLGVKKPVIKKENQRKQKAKQRRLLKLSHAIDPDRAHKVRGIALRYASSLGLGSHAEDFGSYCVMRLFMGTDTKIEFMLTDFKRITFGSTRSVVGKSKMRGTLSGLSINPHPVTGEESHHMAAPERVDDPFEIVDAMDLIQEHRIILVLHSYFGLTSKEIAKCFGWVESNVAHKLKEIRILLSKRVPALES